MLSRNISCADLIPRMIREVNWYKIILRQWALSNLCIVQILNEGFRNFGRVRTASSFIALNLLHLMLSEQFQFIEKSSILSKTIKDFLLS